MSAKDLQYCNRLLMLYSLKLEQLLRARTGTNSFRCMVLQAEAEAINQELKHMGYAR